MTRSAAERLPVLEEVVAALTSAAGSGYGGAAALRAGMRRATDQFDEHAASALARSLVDTLCKNPDDVRVLETLVILGLAHPGALTKHRISLEAEARRLAVLLEKVGQYERAYCLGELIAERAPAEGGGAGGADPEAVQTLVRDAEFAAARGRTRAAVQCLEEAQKMDPKRDDIATSIRELRRKRGYRWAHTKRAAKLALVVSLLSGGATALGLREYRIWKACEALPTADTSDLPTMRERLEGIDALLDKERFWLTMPRLFLERDVLRHEIQLLERPIAPVLTDVPAPAGQAASEDAYAKADAARRQGLLHAEEGRLDEALAELERALTIAPADWVHRSRVQANLAALRAWHQKNHTESSP